ncbi:MAG: hypothetical protein ACM3S1_10465 [Hyphomicrobiales bacterium]
MKQVQTSRIKQERDWKLNMAFYRGQQWVWFNRFTGMVMDIPSPDVGDGPRYRVRLTSNQILPGVQGLLAMMTKTKPVISATPETGAERDIRAAQMAEQLFEHWWRELSLKAKLQEALLWSILGSSGYWKITWDPFAGKPMTFMVGPDGQPILDTQLADIFRDELQSEGKDPKQFEKTVYMGEIRVDVIPPDSLFILDGATSVYESKAIVCKHPMTPDEVKMRFGKDVKANASTTATSFANVGAGTITTQDSSSGPDKNVREVYIGYFAPSPIMPKGRYVVFIDDPDEILYDGPWPYPIVDLPIVEFPGPRVPGSQTNEALVTHARPLQKELNRTISQIVMHKNLTLKPQILAPQGSLAQRITDEPGAIIEFMPVGGAIPQWREMPSIPAYVFEHLRDIQSRLDRLFNLQAISRGDVPPNVEAGIAIDLLQEAAVDQIAPVIQAMEDSLAKAGDIMAAFARHFYTEPRMVQIIGPGGVTKAKRFLGSDIEGGFSFHAEAGSGLPRTRAGRIARVEQLVGMGVLRTDQAWKHLDIADLKGISAMFAADEEQAYREIDKINKGQPVNPQAMQQAMAALQQGVDPDSGQPLQPGVDPQQILMNAGLKPLPFENYQTHLDTHALYMKSVEFESLPPDVQGRHITHYNLTLQTMMSLPARPDPQAVRTTLQLKGTIDPVTASEVLQHSGVPEANPQNLSQPPLDTWVTDDLSKPQAHGSANDPLDDLERIQAMQHAEEQHQSQQAKTAADIALVQKRTTQLGKQQPKSASPKKG